MIDENKKGKSRVLSDALGLSEIFAEYLVKKGIDSPEAGKRFLFPSKEDFEDPFLLSGMSEAVDRIRSAISEKEKIVVYGDYDCDGITATAILYGYLKSIGADVSYFIPNRFDTGYGLSMETLEEIAETYFPDLIITVDCGISSVEEADFLMDTLAIDLIVTDHHNLPSELPNAIVVNPKLDLSLQSTDLCGAGVAFKVVHALGGFEAAWRYVELAAIGTIADIVPLTKENRLIASLGLKKINSREAINKGLRLLIESIDLKGPVDSVAVGFHIGPRINALGRLNDSSEVVNLFVSEEYVELQGLIEKMTRTNELRKSLVNEIYEEAIEMLKDYDLVMHRIILLYKAEWNPGVLGLVAGRLKGEFSRPVVLLCGDEEIKGSARAPEKVDIHATIKSAEDLLVKFGGHKGAAGLTLKRENLIAARNRMDEFLEATYSPECFAREERYDFCLSPDQLSIHLAEEIALLEPTGEQNRKPVFKFDSDLYPLVPFGAGIHGKARLSDCAEIVGFRMGFLYDALRSGAAYDYLCECSKNVYKNQERVQMRVIELFSRGFSEKNAHDDLTLFNKYLKSNLYREEACAFTAIDREELSDAFYDDRFATLFMAYSEKGYALLLSPSISENLHGTEFGKSFEAPWNECLVAPDDDPVGYKRIVLLDTPLTKGYVSRLAKSTGAEILVVKENYPFCDHFAKADLSTKALSDSYELIRRFVFSGDGAASPMDLVERLAPVDPYQFLIHFYVLYECGALSIGQGFSIALRGLNDPSQSVLYRRLLALKRIL